MKEYFDTQKINVDLAIIKEPQRSVHCLSDKKVGCVGKFHKILIVDETFDKKLMLNVCGTDEWFNKRAMKPQNRAESGIFCMEKGFSKNPCYKRDF